MIDVVMPQMGESIVEGTITKWLKQVGEKVEKDEALFEISTDKVDSEVPAPASGVVKEILADEGDTIEINKVVARLEGEGDEAAEDEDEGEDKKKSKAKEKDKDKDQDKDEDKGKKEKKKKEKKEAAEEDEDEESDEDDERAAAQDRRADEKRERKEAAEGERVRSSPLVRRMAREKGVDLSEVEGTGQGGRISKKDLEAYLADKEEGKDEGRKEAPAKKPASGAPKPGAVYDPFPASPDSRFGDYYVEPLSSMRKSIAEHMVRSMHHTAPHVSMVHQIDCTTIAKTRAQAKEKFLEQNGTKLTFMPFFLKAAATALKEFPMVNASLDGSDVVYHRDINIGVAVALDWGLLVPVIKNADDLSIVGLQKAVNDVAERARKKQIKLDELSQSTFSVSNYGGYGSVIATPAINQPNAALLGLGALHKAPVVVGDAIAVRTICYGTLTIDHRLIDGALAAQFMEKLREIIENWSESVL